MKLYDCPRNTWFFLGSRRIFFDHIDGAYSLCHDEDGNTFHLAAWTNVELEAPNAEPKASS